MLNHGSDADHPLRRLCAVRVRDATRSRTSAPITSSYSAAFISAPLNRRFGHGRLPSAHTLAAHPRRTNGRSGCLATRRSSRKSGSQETRRWRKPDSNPWSLSWKREDYVEREARNRRLFYGGPRVRIHPSPAPSRANFLSLLNRVFLRRSSRPS